MARNMHPDDMKYAYESGATVASLMGRTGKSYIEIQNCLKSVDTKMITGGWARLFRAGKAE